MLQATSTTKELALSPSRGSSKEGASTSPSRVSSKDGAKKKEEKPATPKRGIFGAVNRLRESSYDEDQANEEKELAKFNEHTCCGRIARSGRFGSITLVVIVFNALYLGYDADYSARWGKPDDLYSSDMPFGFVFMENLFAIFFTVELLIRFIGYVHKSTFIKDLPFLFDLFLVLVMVAETYPLAIMGSGGALKQFSVLRLLRLARILRMGKLLRYYPELALIVKGMVAAIRSVGCASILLIGVLYVFAIIFANEYHQGWEHDDDIDGEEIEYLFGSLGKSMRHLLIMGTILDDITFCMNTIRSTEKILMVLCFLIFVGISAFTLFNMLLGILCEVVSATGQGEKAKTRDKQLKETITKFFRDMDKDHDGTVSRQEFTSMQDHPQRMKALKKLDIEKESLEKLADVFFNPTPDEIAAGITEKSMNSDHCVAMIMKLRPGKGLNCCDFSYFKKKITDRNKQIDKYLDCIEWMVGELGGFDPSDSEEEDDQAKKLNPKESDISGDRGKPRKNRLSTGGGNRANRSRAKATKRNLSALAHSPAAEALIAPPITTRWESLSTPSPAITSPLRLSPQAPETQEVMAIKFDAIAEKKRQKNLYLADAIATEALANPQMNNWARSNVSTPYTNLSSSGKMIFSHGLRNVAEANNEEFPLPAHRNLNNGWAELDC